MMGTMQGVNLNYSNKGGELLRDAIISRLQRKEFSNLNGKLLRIGVPLSRIDSVLSKLQVVPSPMARSELYRLDLLEIDRSLLTSLALQMYYSGMKSPSPNMSAQQTESAKDKMKEVNYRVKHMAFWNENGLPSPNFIGVERAVDGLDYAMGIVTQYWDGNTHELDMFAINRRLKKIDEQLQRDKIVLSTHIISKLKEEETDLLNKKSEIVSSILKTINDFAVFGTDGLGNNKEMYQSTMVPSADFYNKKA